MGPLNSHIRRLKDDRAASVALVFGLTMPVLALAVAATVEYGSLSARRTKLQRAADTAALAGAQQLRLANTSDATVEHVVRSLIREGAPTPTDSVTDVASSVVDDRSSVRVTVNEVVATVMGKLMSLPTMAIRVEATAKISGSAKLCLLALDVSKGKVLNLDKDSSLTAAGCAIYSNSSDKSGLRADTNARATAALICSAGGVDNKGASLSPTPTTDCPVLSDPLAGIARPGKGSCSSTDLKITTSQTLWPGTYCKGLTISGAAQVTLMPGIYAIDDGPLIVSDTASVSGTNVSFYFTGDAGGLRLDSDTSISLTASKDGAFAGLLLFEDRSVGAPVAPPPGPKGSPTPPPYGSQPMRQYRITSNNAPLLLGTIYLPAGRLIIDASRPVSDRSAYTVIVARQLDLNSGPNLFLNSDYGATDIPAPNGVGPKTGSISLIQ